MVVIAEDVAAARAAAGEPPAAVEWLEAPLDPDALLASVERAVKRPARGRLRILHVENDPDLARVVMAMLGDVADVVHAAGVADARGRLLENRFDLVILDVVLPDGSGLDLLPFLRGDAEIPVVVFSVVDVDPGSLPGVAAALVKTRATHRDLVDLVRAIVGR